MNSRPNYITPAGEKKLRDELSFLLNDERPKVVEVVAWAAGNGDRSENGDYIYGKKRLREIDKRIRFLIKRMDLIQIIDPKKQKSDVIVFGATVTVENEDGDFKTYQIVGIDETEAGLGRISWTSPIGKALLGRKVGDDVEVKAPNGLIELSIVKVVYC
ncbi:MAG: transcription elongation factor GreB [Pseudomonadota bacterium]